MSELIDNRAHRIRTLKGIVLEFSEGGDTTHARAQLRALMKDVDSTEIAAMEQELIADGMPIAKVQSMCDAHSELLRDFVIEPPTPDMAAGNPVETFRHENVELEKVLEELKSGFGKIEKGTGGDVLPALKTSFARLTEIEKHYARKENLIFSVLERHGVSGPSKVMWGKDDEVREKIRDLGKALDKGWDSDDDGRSVVKEIGAPVIGAVTEMISKEEKILLPMCLGMFTEDEWGEIWTESDQFGYCLVEPNQGYQPPKEVAPEPIDLTDDGEIVGDMVFPTGALSFDQLLGIFSHLPVDITFVDADNRVRFFSEGPDRVFDRTPAIIGRKVEHCHPPKSVSTVQRIVADFKSGRQDVAEFWIELGGKFIHIRYFAVRNDKKEFLGTLEVTQDVTAIRKLEGERRLLDYDSPA